MDKKRVISETGFRDIVRVEDRLKNKVFYLFTMWEAGCTIKHTKRSKCLMEVVVYRNNYYEKKYPDLLDICNFFHY